MSLLHLGKGALRVAKNYTKGYSDTQAKVRDATSNDPWGPSGTQLDEIAQLLYNHNDFVEIIETLDKRLSDKDKNWRHVFKSLTVLDYLLHTGSEDTAMYFYANLYTIKTLQGFQHIDENGKDCGANVRQKAKNISNLISDPARLREERRTRANMRDPMNTWHSSDNGEESKGSSSDPVRKIHAPPPGTPPRRSRGADLDEEELRKVIEASKKSLAEVQGRGADHDKEELRKAVDEPKDPYSKMVTLSPTVLNACIIGDLPLAEDLLTHEIHDDTENHNSYANRSFVRAQKSDWDCALHDALQSINIQPSLTGYISKGIALCGKSRFEDSMEAFDMAFMFTGGDIATTHLILLIKAIVLFDADQHERATLRIHELIMACPEADILACHVVEAYLHVQLGIHALDHKKAAEHFTDAVKSIDFSSTSAIYSKYETFVVLFGWDLKSLWKTANRKCCLALLQAGMLTEALELYRCLMDVMDTLAGDEAATASLLDWYIDLKNDCGALCAALGDTAFAVNNYDKAIDLYSAVIGFGSGTDAIFVNSSKAKLKKMWWDEALLDAQKVTEINSSSYLGYQLMCIALHGTQCYDEAIGVFQIMMSKLDDSPDAQELHQQYVSLSNIEGTIRKVIDAQLENAPPRLLNTFSGYLCDRDAQIDAFKMSAEYRQLLSSMINTDFGTDSIQDIVATYFRYAMLSHRWSRKEPLLQDLRDYVVYELNSVDSVVKLQSFCKTARDAGLAWAWSDTCCIDKTNNLEVQESVNSMFVWYSHSALTIIYLSDVGPSSKPGALARSDWNKRGWTVQEFLAPKVVLFYQQDWTLYLNDLTPNHKESVKIMQEMGDATGIDAQALVAFRPGMRGPREKLQWASVRTTTLQEDMAYSLFGIFGIHLPVIYGERRQNALGRLLQEIIARSGDISPLDWVGVPSEFNSCLPADISSYKALPSALPSLSGEQIQSFATSLRHDVTVDLASEFFNLLNNLETPRFANCRLQLPCLVFHVTEVRQSHAGDRGVTYEVRANGLNDLSIVIGDKLSTRQALILVYPWNRYLLERPSLVDDTQGEEYPSMTGTANNNKPAESDLHLHLIVRLKQPFRALLLAQQSTREYRRIASDHDIIAQVQDTTSVRQMMDVQTVEIL